MGWFLGLLSSMFSALSFLIVVGVVVIYVIIRALVGWSQGSSVSASKISENDEDDEDGSAFCMYGLPYIHQHCPNCDLAEHCMGINFHKREESNGNLWSAMTSHDRCDDAELNENLWLLDDSLDSRDMDEDERIHLDDEYAYNEGYDDLDEADDW